MRLALLGLALACAMACKDAEQPSPDAGALPSLLGPPPAGVTRFDFSQCYGCPYCEGGRLIDPNDSRHSRVAECMLENNLLAHGVAYSGKERLQIGPEQAAPFFRLKARKPVRLELPPGTTVFGVDIGVVRRPSCELRMTVRPDTPSERTARLALQETFTNQASVGEVGGPPLDELELEVSCTGELKLTGMWYLPARAPNWPALPDQPGIELEALPEPTGTDGPKLLWAPPVALAHDAQDDMKTLALAVLDTPLVRNQLGLREGDSFEVEDARSYWVKLGRRVSWRDQRLPVVGSFVTVALVAGNRLRSIEYQLGPRITTPKRAPLSEAAVLRLGGRTRQELTKPPWLAFYDGKLVYALSVTCFDYFADAFTGKLLGSHRSCTD